MRRQAIDLANPQIDRRLTEIDRHQLGVDVGQVDERDIAGDSKLSSFISARRG
jgi:hypothetical protein